MADSTSNIISWTPANWITVVLMVAIAYTVAAAANRVWQQHKQNMGS